MKHYPDWQNTIRKAQSVEREQSETENADCDALSSMRTDDVLCAAGLPQGRHENGYVFHGNYEFWLDEVDEALLITRVVKGMYIDGAVVEGLKLAAIDAPNFEWAIPIPEAQVRLADAIDEADRIFRRELHKLSFGECAWALLQTAINDALTGFRS